jgi:hypothetical protein
MRAAGKRVRVQRVFSTQKNWPALLKFVLVYPPKPGHKYEYRGYRTRIYVYRLYPAGFNKPLGWRCLASSQRYDVDYEPTTCVCLPAWTALVACSSCSGDRRERECATWHAAGSQHCLLSLWDPHDCLAPRGCFFVRYLISFSVPWLVITAVEKEEKIHLQGLPE